ncbi:hypothetical protein ACOME3_007435 [Neoechinorhynchus agilis]
MTDGHRPMEEDFDEQDIEIEEDDKLVDYEKFEEVVGNSPANRCTYEDGYMKRQGLFSCIQCYEAGGSIQPSVICYGCAMTCHSDHKPLIEMWTKRNYRCDCGNSRFRNKCFLHPKKDNINVRNDYDNHNIIGLYCSCNGPYKIGEQEMWMCVICEDWFHVHHGEMEDVEIEKSETICAGCCLLHADFLAPYFSTRLDPQGVICGSEYSPASISSLNTLKEGIARVFSTQWRKSICRCSDCEHRIQSAGLQFLTDEDDTLETFLKINAPDEENATVRIVNADIEETVTRVFSQTFDGLMSSGRIQYTDAFNEREINLLLAECKDDLTEYLIQLMNDAECLSDDDIRREIFEWFQRRRTEDKERRQMN